MDFSKKKAIYIQIFDCLCEEILKGMWGVGEKLPSIRETAVSLEVNPNTVVRSYAMLEQEGIVDMKRGIGYFVSLTAKEKILSLKKRAFLKEELPYLFKAMNLLDINMSELTKLYQEHTE